MIHVSPIYPKKAFSALVILGVVRTALWWLSLVLVWVCFGKVAGTTTAVVVGVDVTVIVVQVLALVVVVALVVVYGCARNVRK